MDVRRPVREPNFDAGVNVLGTVRLLQNCVERVVFASTGGAVYGEQESFPAPEDHPQYLVSPYGVSIFAGNLAAGETSTINGTGEQTRDYVFVEDVARANALEREPPNGPYNVGTGARRA